MYAIGASPAVIALHGGPGFRDYLLPDLEPPTSSFRLITYDQRGGAGMTQLLDRWSGGDATALEPLVDRV